MKSTTLYVSGMHSGQNPCAGVGITRSLRAAFPEIRIVGVDHWQGSSGLHDRSIDEALLLPQWKQIGKERYNSDLRALLNGGHVWIAALDTEVLWLAKNFGTHDNLLVPGAEALELTAKPAVTAFHGFDFHVPEFIPVSLSDSEIHSFLRHASWQCWLKSPFHEARRISSWDSFQRSREAMTRQWGTSKLWLQRHVVGSEESIAFSAYKGELLAAVHMEKRLITPEGKTWAGKVTPVGRDVFAQFEEAMRKTGWTGGGELEFTRDPDGKKWIIECNPRYPAWIYGAALSGMNLPAKLVARELGLTYDDVPSRYPFFTRVVQEIPALESVGVPLPPDPSRMRWTFDGKKGKGGPQWTSLMPPLEKEGPDPGAQKLNSYPADYLREIQEIAVSFTGETPSRVHLERWTSSRFTDLAGRIGSVSPRGPQVRIGYSVKTSSTDAHLRKARDSGFLAECISQLEIRRALDFGFKAGQLILNGPGKFWPLTAPAATGLQAVFCDSIEEFGRASSIPGLARCLGFRVRLPGLPSRFGIPIDDFEKFDRLVECAKKTAGRAELGIHFHMPSWAIGVERWNEALESLLLWCRSLETLSGAGIRHVDLGGGFFPEDLQSIDFEAVLGAVGGALRGVKAVYFEPGRALTQDGEILVTRVLDLRKSTKGELVEAVVDGCVAEMPMTASHSHPIFYFPRDGGEIMPMKKGKVRVLGRICMENDILSEGIDLPLKAEIGDLIIFGDAGGYERSMSYDFGRG